ncbi:MAG: hypothetical protein IPO27_08445 [Bacteroidetes bacterium]|nr:hypothetical protein [Bacteroidota bacterium]
MSNNSILQYISQEGYLNNATLEYLDDIITRFPYFQAAHFVKSKVLHSTNKVDFAHAIKQAAIYAPDRSKLHEFINQHYEMQEQADSDTDQDTCTLVSDSELAALNLQTTDKVMHNFTDGILQNLENNFEAQPADEIKVDYADNKASNSTFEDETSTFSTDEIVDATTIENEIDAANDILTSNLEAEVAEEQTIQANDFDDEIIDTTGLETEIEIDVEHDIVSDSLEAEVAEEQTMQANDFNMTSEDIGIDFVHPEIAEEAALQVDESTQEEAINADDEAAHEIASNQSLEQIISSRLDEIELQAKAEDQIAEEMHTAQMQEIEELMMSIEAAKELEMSSNETAQAAEINITSEDIGIDFNHPEIAEELELESDLTGEEEISSDDEAAHEMASNQSLEQIISERIKEIEIPSAEDDSEVLQQILEAEPTHEPLAVDEEEIPLTREITEASTVLPISDVDEEEESLEKHAYVTTNDNVTENTDNDFFGWLKKIKSPSTVKKSVSNSDLIQTFIESKIDVEPSFEIEFVGKDDDKTSIIDEFIEKDPRIEPMKASFYKASNMARKSVEFNDDVVSETLAAIFEKQGLAEKAIKAYEKLCLKYPDKSHLFAARIEKLKNTE